jgi:hypothetical protein
MRSTLSQLAEAQEARLRSSGDYFAELPPDFVSGSGVVAIDLTRTPDGWNALIHHTEMAMTCAIYAGSTPFPPARIALKPACSQDPERMTAALETLGICGAGLLMVAVGVAYVITPMSLRI